MEHEREPDPDEQRALEIVSAFVHFTARRLQVCPCCLIFNLAEMVGEALEEGRLEHGTPEPITAHEGVETVQ